jgi:hypothetical protein
LSERLRTESPAAPRRHFDQNRVRRYAEMLDQLPPATVCALEDQTQSVTNTTLVTAGSGSP